jgi:GT2 family glycosyltransferase
MGDDRFVGVVGAKVYDPDGRTLQQVELVLNDHAVPRFLGVGEKDEGQYDPERDVEYVAGSAWAIRRDLWERLGGLSEAYFPGYFEDVELCWAAHKLGYRVLYLPGVRVCHEGMRTVGRLSREYHYLCHRHRVRFVLRTFEKRRIGSFLRAEIRWVLSFRNCDQYVPLLRAYAWNLLRLWGSVRGRRELWGLLKKNPEFR